MEYKDYYATLGVPRDATAADIQKAYRKLARKYHPDVNSTAGAEERFKEINEAHEVLRDPEKRSKYDRFGSAWKQAQQTGSPPPGFEDIFTVFSGGGRERAGGFGFGGQGFSSFFDMLFGSDFGAATGPRVSWSPTGSGDFRTKGADQQATLSIGLVEAARGGDRELRLTDPTTGRQRTLRVKIPKGVRAGQRIRLAGQGGLSADGSPRGDLYLNVEILADSRFQLDGDDLKTSITIAPWTAALGGQAAVRTLDGPLTIRIPPGSSSGRKIRLRGKGFPNAAGESGDLLAEIRIQVPASLTDRERELFEELARTSSFTPNS